jgi:hypothetical protein
MAFFVTDVAAKNMECLSMDKLKLTGRTLGEFTTLEDGCIIAIHLAIRPNLGLETQPEQLL